MPVDLQILKKHGVTVEKLKEVFTADPNNPDSKVKPLIDLIRSRIQEGITRSLRESRHWAAIDYAFDSAFYQVTPTLARALLSGKMSDEGVLKAAQDWGLSHLITKETSPNGQCNQTVDLPAFFAITVPIAKAYVLIRTAKIFNDRNVYPLFKCEPSRLTEKNKLRCEIITDRIQTMSSQMDYVGIMRQAILNKNIYGICLQFPAEAWYKETQIVESDSKDAKDGEEEKIVKEGLRYNLPHPSRVFYDLNYRVGTLNSDTGCTYAGYWQVQRYGDIKDNEAYWNTDKISFGNNWMLFGPGQTFFSNLYPCVMSFPTGCKPCGGTTTSGATTSLPVGAGATDRENQAGFYASEQSDQAVSLTQLFMKFKPKTYGIGDYGHPVWFRLIVAGESTAIYAEPLAYSPVTYRGYDAHEERELNASLVLEAIPFQDHITNLLTQQLLTIKQNLISAVFFNEDVVGAGTAKKIQNLGQKLFMETTFIPYSSRSAQFAGKDFKEAFFPVNFPRLDTTAILQGIRTLLDMMERVLVMSSQEIGAAASHEQTAQETRVIAQSTSNRLSFTASYDDDADFAWKKQLYDALMAYGSDELYAQVSPTEAPEDMKTTLEKMGFTIEEEGDPKKNTKTLVKGGKTALLYEEFASDRSTADRIDNVALSNAMVQLLQVVMANPALFAAIGPVQAVKIINQIGQLAGFYKDFKLEVMDGSSPEEVQAHAQEQIGQMLAQMKQQFEQQMAQVIGPLNQGLQQLSQEVAKVVQAMGVISQKVQGIEQSTAQAVQVIGQKDQEQDAAIARITSLLEQAQSLMAPPPPPAMIPPGIQPRIPGIPMGAPMPPPQLAPA